MSGWDAHLDPDETILWEGRPTQRLFDLRVQDLYLVPFSVLWLGFVLMAFASGGFQPLLLIFVLVGLYFAVGRFLVDALRRRSTTYALSDRRAFIAVSWPRRSLRERPIFAQTELHFEPGDPGSLTLGPKGSFRNGLGVWSGDDGSFTFRKAEGIEEVYRQVRAIQRGVA
ncbi:hypothetical protein ILP92_01250 [Maribius pontilimi]|uniref:PH domain-containing protein n=1 Tax=Palleronia pontilimi TaxID=1964209 RepID=A0A934I708_9RHOB|nr:hypothetical protein [Palleronia pontilimi]MBJ3761378.1 hypothetical protein [Palleronia pontilimi]